MVTVVVPVGIEILKKICCKTLFLAIIAGRIWWSPYKSIKFGETVGFPVICGELILKKWPSRVPIPNDSKVLSPGGSYAHF